jgi:hypothetical protein
MCHKYHNGYFESRYFLLVTLLQDKTSLDLAAIGLCRTRTTLLMLAPEDIKTGISCELIMITVK